MKANEFVKKFGWEEARKACSGVFSGEVVYKRENINIDDLRAAIADHDRTDFVSDIRNHISPTTVVIGDE